MKRIIVACGSGIATSTIISSHLSELLDQHHISYELIQCSLQEIDSYVDDADLSKNLQYVAEFANVKNIGLGYLTEDLHKYSNTNALQNRLVTVEKASVAIDDIGDTDFLQLAESASTVSIKDATAAQLYVASGVIEENALNTLVAEELDRIIKDYNNVVAVDGEIGLYDHSYTVSVSTCTKAIGEVDVTFVAVQVVRSSVRS